MSWCVVERLDFSPYVHWMPLCDKPLDQLRQPCSETAAGRRCRKKKERLQGPSKAQHKCPPTPFPLGSHRSPIQTDPYTVATVTPIPSFYLDCLFTSHSSFKPSQVSPCRKPSLTTPLSFGRHTVLFSSAPLVGPQHFSQPVQVTVLWLNLPCPETRSA